MTEVQPKTKRQLKTELRDRLIASLYASNGRNGTQAYLTLFPNAKPSTATVHASKIIRKDNVQEMIQQALAEQEVTMGYVIQNYKKTSEYNLHSGEKPDATSLKATENLEKLLIGKQESQVKHTHIHASVKPRVLKNINKIVEEGIIVDGTPDSGDLADPQTE